LPALVNAQNLDGNLIAGATTAPGVVARDQLMSDT
jgi:hypothetical protein